MTKKDESPQLQFITQGHIMSIQFPINSDPKINKNQREK